MEYSSSFVIPLNVSMTWQPEKANGVVTRGGQIAQGHITIPNSARENRMLAQSPKSILAVWNNSNMAANVASIVKNSTACINGINFSLKKKMYAKRIKVTDILCRIANICFCTRIHVRNIRKLANSLQNESDKPWLIPGGKNNRKSVNKNKTGISSFFRQKKLWLKISQLRSFQKRKFE